MKKVCLSFLVIIFHTAVICQSYSLVIHGGAGGFDSSTFSEEEYSMYHDKLRLVILAGDSLLSAGHDAIDVVEYCVVLLEDSPLFNAGRGSVLNAEGNYELDASIMDGKSLNAGAVAGVRNIKNPIKAARLVMDSSRHVMLSSTGAEKFLEQFRIETVEQDYFYEENTYNRFKELKKKDKGTVGAVALDIHGNLAAATSTGGMMMKRYGRIGDSPIIGAGCYADNSTAAISCTGHGEFFIRTVAAYKVTALMKYAGMNIVEAAQKTIDDIGNLNATGGIIAVDKNGNIAMPFNTKSMFRAFINGSGEMGIEF